MAPLEADRHSGREVAAYGDALSLERPGISPQLCTHIEDPRGYRGFDLSNEELHSMCYYPPGFLSLSLFFQPDRFANGEEFCGLSFRI